MRIPIPRVFWIGILASIPVLAGTLTDAFQSMLQNHPQMEAMDARILSRQANIEASKSSQLPRVDAHAKYQLLTEKSRLQMELPPVAPGMPPIQINRALGDYDRSEMGITAKYAIFTGFAQKNMTSSLESSRQALLLERDQIRNNLALQFGILHYATQSALLEHSLRVRKVQFQESLLKTLEAEFRSGVLTEVQVLSAKADLAKVLADTIQSMRIVDSLRLEFENLTGMPYPSTAQMIVQTLADQVVRILQSESLEEQARAVQKSADSKQASRYPWITTYASFLLANPGLNQSSNTWMGYGVFGLQAEWNLFDGFERSHQKKQADADARSLRAEAKRVRSAQELGLRNLGAEARATAAEAAALASGTEAARSARNALQVAVQNGTSTPTDLLLAETRLAEIETRIQQLENRVALIHLKSQWLAGHTISFQETHP